MQTLHEVKFLQIYGVKTWITVQYALIGTVLEKPAQIQQRKLNLLG